MLIAHRTHSLFERQQFGVACLIPLPIRRLKVVAQLFIGRPMHPCRTVGRYEILPRMLPLTVDVRVCFPKPQFGLLHLVT